MTLRALFFVWTVLSWTVAVAHAGRAPEPPVPPPAGGPRAIRSTPEAMDGDRLALGRAAMEQRLGNPRGVIESLENVDFSRDPTWIEADRAAFLLAQAYLEIGAVGRFLALERDVSRWERRTHYTRWLAHERMLVETERGGAFGSLSAADTTTALGRDLAGAALIRLATRELARGGDARPLLEQVPVASRYAARAIHMRGLIAQERGEKESGTRLLESLLVTDPGYSGTLEVRLALAGAALEAGRWEDAAERYAAAEATWQRDRAMLRRILAHGTTDSLWTSWRSRSDLSDALLVDGRPVREGAQRLAIESADLTGRPVSEPTRLVPPVPPPAFAGFVAPPRATRWDSVTAAERRIGETEAERERTGWAIAGETQRLAASRRYLGAGLEKARREARELAHHAVFLDSLRRTLEELDLALRGVRDAERRRIAARTTAILESCARSLQWMQGMRRLSIEGPALRGGFAAPDGYPTADSLLAEEERLARAIEAATARLAKDAPGLLDRSYELAWRPALIERAARQAEDAARALAWARTLETTLDSGLVAGASSVTLRRLERRADTLVRETGSLRAAALALREGVAREAVTRALEELEGGREALDYGLAACAYGLAVRLGAPVATRTSVTPEPDSAARRGEDSPDEPGVLAWRGQAIVRADTFLVRHPWSAARGEMRFRLADLSMLAARHTFRERMAGYVAAQGDASAKRLSPPTLDHARALGLYRKILEEDHDFPHRDAVLFNAAMILADDGDPGASGLFRSLASDHPASPYLQEAFLRMGDLEFNERRFEEGIAHYARAVEGPDAGLTVIALYKSGWAHFNEDRFVEAADAFRSVLDLYGSPRRAEIKADIEGEAQSYLVHSLAGAGGAEAFAEYFDRIGPRPYALGVLRALGQHFRRYGEYPRAAAVEELCIRRYPLDPEALASAGRLVETWQRSNRAVLVREARLSLAPQFGPQSRWSAAQASDSLRAAGAAFARAGWTAVAVEQHRLARDNGRTEDWTETLKLYETLLKGWPGDSGAAAFQLGAGEARARLGDPGGALAHYRAAAESPEDSLAEFALGQVVAVTDAWYERTRAGSGVGSDSLARGVIEAGDRLLARAPTGPKAADITWRQGQLGLAHHWYARAADDLGRLAVRHPNDPRAPLAVSRRGEALFQIGEFERAAVAFEEALLVARRAGRDSLARNAERAIPICRYRHAEAAVAADSSRHERHAELFEVVATRWPGFEHADLAAYRAGLAWLAAGRERDAVRVLEGLIQKFPGSSYAKDAHLQRARTLAAIGERERAADGYLEFATRYGNDLSARAAVLTAADLLDSAGLGVRAEGLRLDYLRRFPHDHEAAMEILEPLARRDLAAVGASRPLSTLLAARIGARRDTMPRSHVADYLRRAALHPNLASRALIAEVRFLEGEETRTAYLGARLVQPLTKSLAARQKLLDSLVVRYRRCVDLGVAVWAHASAYRIGEALVAFGDALVRCERPADLKGDDLRAYEDVLIERGQTLFDRGESVWTELLKGSQPEAPPDRWVAQAQASLWLRHSERFLFRPEVEFPLVLPKSRPQAVRPEGAPRSAPNALREGSGSKATLARDEGVSR